MMNTGVPLVNLASHSKVLWVCLFDRSLDSLSAESKPTPPNVRLSVAGVTDFTSMFICCVTCFPRCWSAEFERCLTYWGSTASGD